MARLGPQGSQEVRTSAPRTRGDRSGDLAIARIFSNAAVPVQPTDSRVLASRLVTQTELSELARSAGIDPKTLAPNASFFVSPPSGNAVVQTNDLTSVTPHVGGHAIEHRQSTRLNDDGTMTFTGSELLDTIAFPPPIGGVDSEIPAGGLMALVPANPRFVDGSRLGAFLSTFDQFCLEEVTYEYVAGSSFTTPGQLMLAYINDMTDDILTETGLAALRDAYTRDGSTLFSVTKNAHIKLGRPLLKWFFTDTQADTALEMPGMICMWNQLDTTTTEASVPLGSLVMHYRVRVRAPSFAQGNFTTYTAQSASLNFTSAIIQSGSAICVSAANSGLPANLLYPNAVYWGIIASASDPGGVSTWRTWKNPVTTLTDVPAPGRAIFWRYDAIDDRVYFFANQIAAINSTMAGYAVNYGYTASSTVAAGSTKGFKLWNISGSDVQGHNAN